MSGEAIGRVKSPRGKEYEVKWDPASHDVYVSYAGVSKCREKASSAAHAMRVAEAYLYDK